MKTYLFQSRTVTVTQTRSNAHFKFNWLVVRHNDCTFRRWFNLTIFSPDNIFVLLLCSNFCVFEITLFSSISCIFEDYILLSSINKLNLSDLNRFLHLSWLPIFFTNIYRSYRNQKLSFVILYLCLKKNKRLFRWQVARNSERLFASEITSRIKEWNKYWSGPHFS